MTPVHTPYHALVGSPLGPILLSVGGVGLCGLHFIDQRDCPQVPGVPAVASFITQPAAGESDGRPSRTLRVTSAQVADATFLPGLPDGGDLSGGNPPALMPADAPALALQWLQPQVPAAVRSLGKAVGAQLQAYWQGKRHVFDVPLDPQGTPFQKKIWQALLDVPFGATLSYGQLAQNAGLSAGHGRAAGTAVGSNPISIIIPCHRILARDGTLNGYGGGLHRKMKLLRLEGLRVGA